MVFIEQQRAEIGSLALSKIQEDPYAGLPVEELVDSLDAGALPDELILDELHRGNGPNARGSAFL